MRPATNLQGVGHGCKALIALGLQSPYLAVHEHPSCLVTSCCGGLDDVADGVHTTTGQVAPYAADKAL